MFGWFHRRFVDPDVNSYLVSSEDEEIIFQIPRHWISYWRVVLEALGVIVLAVLLAYSPPEAGWVFLVAACVVAAHCGLLFCRQRIERVVLTNHKIFRVWGPFNRRVASIPINKVLDITLQKPPLGRITGYGHFVFESAAQDQGLREVRYVPKPDLRHQTIQWALQRSGVRASVRMKSNVNDWK